MYYKKVYAVIFALTLFFIGNSSVYAYNNTDYTYNYTGTEHWTLTPVVDNDPFILDVYQKSNGESYVINLGNLSYDGYSNVVDFVAIDVNSTVLRFVVLFGEYTYNGNTTYLSDLLNSKPVSVIRERNPMYNNDTDRMVAWYLDLKDTSNTIFKKAYYFEYDTKRYRLNYNTAVDNLPFDYTGGGLFIQRSNITQYAIPYATRNIYNTTNGIPNDSLYYESSFKPIPSIKVTSHFTKLSTGAYNFGFNVMPAYKGMYFELTDLTTGQVFSDDVDDDLKAYSYVVQSDITTNKLYYLKIWNNKNKEILYYSGSLQGIIDEKMPHIVADVSTIENGYNVEYYYQNTTSKYTCSYTLNNIEWITEECTSAPKEISITQNGLLGIQIINNRNDEIVDKYLLNLVVNPSEPYITFGGSMNKTTHVYTLKYNTFNYENSDNLYYSKDGVNWIYLNNFDGEIDFIESGINVYFKLESSSGTIKYQTMFNLNFNINGDYSVADTKGFFESISYVVSNGLNAIMILYHNLPQEIIIAIGVMCPLILLCIAFEVWRKS